MYSGKMEKMKNWIKELLKEDSYCVKQEPAENGLTNVVLYKKCEPIDDIPVVKKEITFHFLNEDKAEKFYNEVDGEIEFEESR